MGCDDWCFALADGVSFGIFGRDELLIKMNK
jgi:hypothetical protein